ncbi:N-succinylarginine dihydrolase [Aliagarivorans taiwanensis]|uniref:N-succinylarginine dihydrolase n=1 Tax=Aliagarivorans taiwanensis TaxID=561966 RepID=UPI00041B39A3|nr:N-succinylarginine dihydrolase [Aliagarivorans taiwanensis]
MKHFEVNFDGLVGPTHNYAGLSFGNVASQHNAKQVANPQQAAKQGLDKMKALADLGFKQGVLAPQQRPDLQLLRRIGFSGSDTKVISQAASAAPDALLAAYSASSMWTANAATVSPSADTTDGKVHFTPANLTNKLHRSLEPQVTGNILRAVFNDSKYFAHHQHLPENDYYGDEGAANHTRLCGQYGDAGLELFVYGRSAADASQPAPTRYPARQTLEASQAIARLHGLSEDTALFIQQNPQVIDKGVFHNDVIAVGNRNVLFYHQEAFLDTEKQLARMRQALPDVDLQFIEVPAAQVSVEDAVTSYLFNTQLVSLADNKMALIAPTDCQENPAVAAYLSDLLSQNTPIQDVHYMDVKQSMRNGGGPACLRLRVALTDQELSAVNPYTLLDNELYTTLNQWVDKHYRDRLSFDDLKDPQLVTEVCTALDELTRILNIGSVYPFQQ